MLPVQLIKNNKLDQDSILSLVVMKLKLCSLLEIDIFLDKISPSEVGVLLMQSIEDQKEYFELISYAERVAYVSAMSGKDISLFDKPGQQMSKDKVNTITEDYKEAELEALNSIFD